MDMDNIDEVLKVLKLPDNFTYKILEFDFKDEINYSSTFRIAEVRDAESAMEWTKLFQNQTSVTWRSARTHKSGGVHNIFRKDFRCQHNTDVRRRAKNLKINKNTDCRAHLKIFVQRFFEHKKWKSPNEEVKQFPCLVELMNTHNHSVNSAAALRFRDLSEETKAELKQLFELGHSASSAYHALREYYQTNFPEHYEDLVSDASLLPSVSVIQHLFNREFESPYKVKGGKDTIEDLKLFCSNYNDKTSGKMSMVEVGDNVVVSICTPIMLRTVLLVPEAKELVLVDVLGHLDNLNHRIYFVVVPCVAGGAPIGCLITGAKGQEAFETGLNLLKTCWPSECDMTVSGPEVVIIEGGLQERDALSNIWPKCTFLLSQFHVLKALWRWLCDGSHRILPSDRQKLFFAFKSMMYADSEYVFNAKTEFLASIEAVKKYPNFVDYINELLAEKELWADYLRHGLSISSNNYKEIVFRITKEILFSKVKPHSLIQLVDFISTGYEKHLRQRYLDSDSGMYMRGFLRRFIKKFDNKLLANATFDSKDNIFIVKAENSSNFVDMNSSFCSCMKGSTSELCSHIWKVSKTNDIKSAFLYSDLSREIMYKIATGKDISESFLNPISSDPNQTNCSSSISDPVPSCSQTQSSDDDNMFSEPEDDIPMEDEDSMESLEQLFSRIREGYKNRPAVFKPAINAMVQNVNKYAATEKELISALYNFGKICDPTPLKKSLKRKEIQVRIPVVKRKSLNVIKKL